MRNLKTQMNKAKLLGTVEWWLAEGMGVGGKWRGAGSPLYGVTGDKEIYFDHFVLYAIFSY